MLAGFSPEQNCCGRELRSMFPAPVPALSLVQNIASELVHVQGRGYAGGCSLLVVDSSNRLYASAEEVPWPHQIAAFFFRAPLGKVSYGRVGAAEQPPLHSRSSHKPMSPRHVWVPAVRYAGAEEQADDR